MEQLTFDAFIRLSGCELQEGLGVTNTLSEETAKAMAENIWAMDEQHISAAVTLLSYSHPNLLLPMMQSLLSDERSGVWSAAERALLNKIAKIAVTSEEFTSYMAIIQARWNRLGDSYVPDELTRRFSGI